MKKLQREKLHDSIKALKGAAIGIAAAIDLNEESMSGDQAYHLLNTIAAQQSKLIDTTDTTDIGRFTSTDR